MRQLLFSIILCGNIYSLSAQVDAHYWSHQYGAKGLLLNGAVIASPSGETSIFYNPGAIGIDDNLGFAFSFLSPTYSQLHIENIIGDDNNITDRGLGFSPGFIGARFKPFRTDKIIAGAALFERYKTDIDIDSRVVNRVNSDRLFRADLDFRRKISEEWLALGLAYNISPNFGIGLSQFSVWHSQNLELNVKKEILQTDIPTAVEFSWRNEFNYSLNVQSGFITKVGFSYQDSTFNAGLTYTSPVYGLIRKDARYATEDHRVNNIKEEYSSTSNRKETELLDFRSPSSVGVGLDIKVNKSQFSLAVEYFNRVPVYELINDIDNSFDGLISDEEPITVALSTENKAVTNMSVGLQHRTSDKATIYAGFRTDYDQSNTLIINQNLEYLGTVGNIYHLSGGSTLTGSKNVLSVGIDIGYGSSGGGRQLADLSNLTQENLFTFSGKENVDSQFFSFMLFMTYDFIFSGFQRNRNE